ncbi:Glycosyl transferase family 2 [Aquisphaera giovannonii]|uniref:Glycosyl transferase family 2 n=1 Tax=Aquisphaera giovannonii TaxID=406548 RepID=A0A5B9W3F5_9BACT|nr:glycosyltransferase [Aquisphaera giovannonii]QEH34779.1 Glycosyl transferase family 2 [Aquisphaera giovannonii]
MTLRATIVVPTYRRPDLLDRCLQALTALDFDPAEGEIVVADDAGSEETRTQVEGWARRSAIPIRYATPASAHGPAAARNAGWRAGQGGIVAFTDDDCIPDPRWLAEGVAAIEAGADAASGRVVVPLPERPTDYERDAAGLARAEFVTASCFVRRDVLESVGGFDERYAQAWREDSDLQFALLERGCRIDRASRAVVVHPVRPAPWGISLRQQRKSLFNALLYKKFPDRYRRQIRASPPWDYYATIGAMATAAAAAYSGSPRIALAAAAIWAALTVRFCARRLRHAATDPRHVLEMAVTSALIPPLSVFWRLYGAFKFRVLFL